MNEQELLTTITKNAYTKSDIQRRLRIFRGYLEHSFYSQENTLSLEDFLDSKQTASDDRSAIVSWGEAFAGAFTKDTMYHLIDMLIERSNDLPEINVYIPYEPVPGEIAKMGSWFRKNVNPAMLVNLHIDPTILGGCAFAWQGIYRDYSLRHYIMKHRDAIVDIIRRYAEEKTKN